MNSYIISVELSQYNEFHLSHNNDAYTHITIYVATAGDTH